MFEVEDIDFTKPFISNKELNIDTDVDSLYDVKRYIKLNRGENK